MTDNEIIKALECCSTAQNCTPCKYEPTEYQKGTFGCCNELMKNAIDLIERQQAEIERLKNVPPVATVVFDKNDIRNILAEKFGDIETTIKEMHSEAITELAERLNDFLEKVCEINAWYEKLLCSADNCGGKEGENLDLAVTLLAQKAENYGIQWQDLLGADIVGKVNPFRG